MLRIFTLSKKSIRYIKHFGFIAFLKKAKVYMKDRLVRSRDNISYQEFVKKEQKSLKNVSKIKKEIDSFRYKPLISVIIPTYKTPIKFLKEAIDSIQKQFYNNFEIIIYDDASKSVEIDNYFKNIQIQNLRVFYNKKNSGISETSNNSVKESKGEYLVFLDHDDTLSPDALYEIVKILNKNRNIDYLYSDEDKLSKSGEREDPFFKPDFSYDMLLSCMYITHIRAIKKSTFLKLKGLDPRYDGAQDWDFALRLYEHKGTFYHIPKILYHWRKTDQSTANESSGAKSYAYKRQKELLEAHLRRSKIEAEVKEGYWKGSYKIDYKIEDSTQGEPKVSIIIPFRDQAGYLKTCIDSIKEKTTYKNYKIILVNNQSIKQETLDYLKNLESRDDIDILNYNRPFNYSLINNFAVKKIDKELTPSNLDSDFVIFLNNDTKIITPSWIEEMLQIAQRQDVGAVGGLLLYKDGTVQHAGIVVGLGGVAAHGHRGFDGASNGHAGLLTLTRDVSAVTAACLMIERSKFLKVKGFDDRLRVAYNDVDLCLRLGKIGLKSIYTPYMKMYHFETKTRKKTVGENTNDTGLFIRRWKYFLKKGDPFYNPNFTLSKEDYSLRRV